MCDGRHLVELVGSQEGLSQSGVAPLCLTANQLGLNGGAALDRRRLGLAGDVEQVHPLLDLGSLLIMGWLGGFQISAEGCQCRFILPLSEWRVLTGIDTRLCLFLLSHHCFLSLCNW